MSKTKKMTTISLLCALSYIAVFVSQSLPPIVANFPFLKYDPKDAIIVVGGLLYGPTTAIVISIIVALAEMFTISGTHIIGCFMNIASSCAFACVASVIYSKYRSIKGAGIGLALGTIATVATMLILNYLLTPIYTGWPRAVVAEALVPGILPFNLIKCVLNSALTLVIYKPLTKSLRRSGLLPKTQKNTTTKTNISVIITAIVLILLCIGAMGIIND